MWFSCFQSSQLKKSNLLILSVTPEGKHTRQSRPVERGSKPAPQPPIATGWSYLHDSKYMSLLCVRILGHCMHYSSRGPPKPLSFPTTHSKFWSNLDDSQSAGATLGYRTPWAASWNTAGWCKGVLMGSTRQNCRNFHPCFGTFGTPMNGLQYLYVSIQDDHGWSKVI